MKRAIGNCLFYQFLCMQFQIAFDLTAKYPTVEPEPFAEGRVSYNIYYCHA